MNRLPLDVCTHSLEPFIDMMMANVTDCDYNKSLLYAMAKSRSGHLRLGLKILPDGKDAVPIITHEPAGGGDPAIHLDIGDWVFSIMILRRDAPGSYEVPPVYKDCLLYTSDAADE